MYPKDLLLIDLETTGLATTKHTVVQIGAVLLQRATLEEIYSFCSTVQTSPEQIKEASKQAMEMHKISPEILQDSLPWSRVFSQLLREASSYQYDVAGFNLQFDISFMKQMCYRYHMSYPFGRNRAAQIREVDLWPVFLYLGAVNRYPYMKNYASLREIHKFFFGNEHPAHDALQDCRALASCLRAAHQLLGGLQPHES